jgi:predicted dehydrogenase
VTEGKYDSKVGVALIGAGHVVRSLYLPILTTPDSPFRLVNVYDPDTRAARSVAGQTQATVAGSTHDAIDHDDVRAVFVCSPKEAHLDAVFAAIEQGRHVLCEKPLGRNGDEALAMLHAAEKAHVVHMVNFVYRYRPGPGTARRLLRNHDLGDIYHVTGTLAQGSWFTADRQPTMERPSATPWRFGKNGGVVRDLGPHLIDMCAPLGRVRWVQAFANTLRANATSPEDVSGFSLGFANGTVAQLMVSRWATGHWENLSVQFSGSQAATRFDRGVAELWTRRDPEWRVASPPTQHRTFLDVFRGAIDGDADDVPTFHDGAHNSIVLDAILRSAATKTTVPIDERLYAELA